MRANAIRLTTLVVIGLTVTMAPTASAAERLSDREVKELFEAVHQARDRFEDQLDGKLKNAILRSSRGEVAVRQYLDDFQGDVENMKSRYTDRYAASQEVSVVLEKGTAMQKFLDGYDKQMKGRSEFDHLAAALEKLASVYGATFPMAAGAAVRRYNDAEVAQIASTLAVQADALKKTIDQEKTLPAADKKTAKADLDQFKKAANTLKSRVTDGKPAGAEMRQVTLLGDRVGQFVGAHQLPAASLMSWGSMKAGLETLNRAFGL